ncbi:hypothetical protein BDN71DRAFT_1444433 [Pleurotus eryngii]|uniref:Uncharacterized protein n=1 Tax=Pleurotus eryngii TaxID=5323 RepID=A0A9P6A0J3_PLEER|nr:hypothetical protein BDN71DRAFT_1444433 [Pleurotus eryngii]
MDLFYVIFEWTDGRPRMLMFQRQGVDSVRGLDLDTNLYLDLGLIAPRPGVNSFDWTKVSQGASSNIEANKLVFPFHSIGPRPPRQ